MEQIEFKIRWAGDYRKWEEIPVSNESKKLEFSAFGEAFEALRGFLDVWNSMEKNKELLIFEIRMNRIGSLQGHYITDWGVYENYENTVEATNNCA